MSAENFYGVSEPCEATATIKTDEKGTGRERKGMEGAVSDLFNKLAKIQWYLDLVEFEAVFDAAATLGSFDSGRNDNAKK